MSPARLRPLTPSDLDVVAEIERETFADAWSRRSFAGMLKQPHVHAVAAEDSSGRVIGYGMCSVAADEGEILNIAVTPSARHQGLGRQVLAALLAHLQQSGSQKAYLEVRRSNTAAIALYRGAGFLPLGVRPAYYAQPREDALTMTLELGSQTARK